jgi:hypothetical protein
MSHKDHPNSNPINTGTRRITLVGLAGEDESEGIVRVTNQGLDVNIQDQFTDAIAANFNQVTNSTELTDAIAIDDLDIVVDDATGVSAGSYIILFHPGSVRFSTFIALSVVSTTITLDTPIDFAYPAGTFVDIAVINLAVDGSSTTQTFGLRGTGAPPGVDLSFDVTRIIFTCITATAVDLSKFGDIAAGITNGLVLRKRDGTFHNVFNIKTNGDIANLMFDWTVHQASNPIQGQDGFISRMTFAGQDKMGVTIRLAIGEDLEFLVQDNLSTITSFKVIAEGHIVE